MSLHDKLFAIQTKGVHAEKDGHNPHYKSQYVTLDNLLSVVLPIAKEYGLLITNTIVERELVTSIMDLESGESVKSHFPISQDDPQKIGSAITYARRYNIGAIFNLITDYDDDGNFAAGIKVETTPKAELTDYIARMKET